MLKKRRVFLTEAIDDKVAKRVCMELMFLDAEEPGTKIVMFINSPGGRVRRAVSHASCVLSGAAHRWMDLVDC
eukprot:209332-Rhodomonas_salina.7